MSQVTNNFRKGSGINIVCRHSKRSEPFPPIQPGKPSLDIPEVNNFDRLLFVKVIKNNKIVPSDIQSISCENSKDYEPVYTYTYFGFWLIGAKRKGKGNGIDPFQTNVNVEIGP